MSTMMKYTIQEASDEIKHWREKYEYLSRKAWLFIGGEILTGAIIGFIIGLLQCR